MVKEILSVLLLQSSVDVAAESTKGGFLAMEPPRNMRGSMLPFGMPIASPLDDVFMPRGFVSEHRPETLPMGLAALLGDLEGADQAFGGHSTQISQSMTTEKGADGKEHLFQVETRCVDDNCTKTKREVNSEDTSVAQTDEGDLPVPVIPGDLDQLFGQLFGGEVGAVMSPPPGFESLRLRLRPDHKFNVAPLEHSTNEDGSETIHGDLPKALNSSNLAVEQRGHVVVIRYTLNQTVGSGDPVGVEQHVRLGFQPAKKEKAHYDPTAGYFQMVFPRPESDDFDPRVEIVFGSDDSQTKAPTDRATKHDAPAITARITKGRSSEEQDKKQPSLLLEIGADELQAVWRPDSANMGKV